MKIDKKRYFLIYTMTFWFSSITFIQSISSRSSGQLSGYLKMVVPELIFFFFVLIIMLKKPIFYKKQVNYKKSALTKGPNLILLFYFLFSGITLPFSSIASNDEIIFGYGYLASYSVAFLSFYFAIRMTVVNKSTNRSPKGFVEEDACKAAYYASTLIVLLFYYFLFKTSNIFAGRHEFFLKAGGMGLILLTLVCFILVFGVSKFRLPLLISCFIVLFLTYSRSALVGIFFSIFFVTLLKHKNYYILSLIPVVVISFLYNRQLTDFLSEILLLNDFYHGLNQLSGRFDIWNECVDLFKKNPLTGIGFRLSDSFLYGSAHNAYLMSIVETGIIGTVLLLASVVWTIIILIKDYLHTSNKVSLFLLGIIAGSMAFGVGERFLINVGNVTSLMVLFSIPYGTSLQRRFQLSHP